MSYPTIGMFGIVPDDKWTPEVIERLLRDGAHIFDDRDGDAHIEFSNGKFRYVYIQNGKPGKEPRGEVVHETFLELASWFAFYGKDFL